MKQKYFLFIDIKVVKTTLLFYKKSTTLSLFVTLVTLFGVSSAFAQFPGNDNAPGVGKTFTVPANVTHVNAAAWGAGGGGGGSSTNGSGGNGGGGGGAASSQIAVTNGNIFTYTLTAGGAGGAAAAGKGGDGLTTTITAITPATNLTGGGGTGGLGNAAAITAGNSGGGTASGGTTNLPGLNGGQGGNSGGNGGNSGTASTVFGTGGTGATNNNGNPGGQPGAGGSGGERGGGNNYAGGAGAPGRVMFDYITVSSITPDPVCVGATITITGTNFSGLGTTTVTVNGTACTSVNVVNATTITALVGVGTTTGVVDINNNGRRNNGQSITVNDSPTITLTSAVGTNSQSRCINTALTDITYSITGGGVTGAGVTGLPAGVTSGFAVGVLTINGAPTASGSYTYTVTTTGGSCVSTTTGTITVSALPTIVLTSAAGTSNQSICRGTAITNITYSIGGSALGVTPTGLPAGVTGNLVGTTYTLSGTPTANGTFNYTLTTTGGSCSGVTINGTITVNALPANPGNPTSNSPQCNPTGVTLTRVGTPPVGETWYWQTASLGTSTANSGTTFNVTTSATYYLRAQNDVTGCWSAVSGFCAVVITPPLATIAGTPSPANAATGICYSGIGAISSISWSAAAGATSYNVYFGAGSLPGSVTANVLAPTVTFSTGTLLANTTYYWKIVPKNACGDSTGSPTTWGFTTASAPCYCTSSGGTFPDGIKGVNFNTINNLGTSVNTAYTNFTAISTTVVKGFPYNLNIFLNTGGNFTDHQSVYIDWNGNGSFADAGELYNLGTATNVTNGLSSLSPLSITIPVGAITGSVRMRVQSRYNSATGDPCLTGFDGEVEDYTIIITDPVPCVIPTAQPTSLVLTSNGSTINGAFTAASPVPNNYLVVVNTSGVAPTPVNGTTYGIGSTALGGTNVVVDNDSNTSFSATSLTPFTTYYFFVYAMNNYCTGGPLYLSTSPLTGNATTDYCVPSVGATYENLVYFTNIAFVGTLNDVSNSSTYSSAPIGYQNFSTLPNRSQQAQGQGINISTQTSSRGYLKAWVDWNKDGDFADAGEKVYDVGGIASYSTTFGFIIPPAQAIGNYRIRINKDDSSINCIYFGVCSPNAISSFDSCQNINYYGETEDYEFTVVASCSAYITGVTDGLTCGSGTVTLAATSTGGATEYRWYNSEFGGTPIATTVAGTWTTPVISTTTTYWLTAFNGCESLVRTKIRANVNPIATITFTPSVPEVCGENQVLSLTAAGDVQQTYLVNEPFNSGLGVMSNQNIVSNGGTRDAITSWQNQTSTFVPAQQVWFPAIASGINGNSFAMATSDIGSYVTHNAILSPVVNTNTYLNLTLSFDIFYSRYYVDGTSLGLDYVTVDVSTNSGTNWTEIDRYTADIGYGTRFVNKSYTLNSYVNNPNFRVRIRYYGEWCDGLAIDNFKLYGNVPLNTSFNWSSATTIAAFTDATCLIPYTGTPITTVYVRPTLAQLEDPNYSFTVTATLSNGCSVSQNISIANKSKIWKGINGNWNDANNWSPLGVPDATNCVIVPPAPNNSVVGGTNFYGLGKTLQVIGSGNLTINPTNSLTITDFVEVRDAASVFNIEDSGSLVQINNVTNLGKINYKRIAPAIRGFDYVYWSSPVANQTMETIYSSPVSGFKYAWNTTVPNGNAGLGNWENASGIMQQAKGYIIRGSSSYGMPATNISATFTGVPHNGTIPFTVARGSYTGGNYNGTNGIQITNLYDNLNLLGNPYPSGIDAVKFLNQNNSVILGNVKLWSHGAAPAAITNPFYGSFTYNYTGNDYVTINTLGSIPATLGTTIKSGQAFFVQMIDGAAGTGIVNFENTMRLNSGIPYNNGSFFRNSEATNQNINTSDLTEKHRIWLDIMDSNNTASSTLVGYATGATDAFDSSFDVRIGIPNYMKLYSLLDNEVYEIQGKSLPFNQNDQIPLGITTVTAENYTIGLNTIDGLFLDANQAIYLEDKTTNVIHNLKTSPYTFTSTAGNFHDRFVLRFTDGALGSDEFTSDTFAVSVISSNGLAVKSTSKEIQSVRVFDILGRQLAYYPNVNSYEIPLSNIQKNNTTLIIKVTLSNGAIISEKAIY